MMQFTCYTARLQEQITKVPIGLTSVLTHFFVILFVESLSWNSVLFSEQPEQANKLWENIHMIQISQMSIFIFHIKLRDRFHISTYRIASCHCSGKSKTYTHFNTLSSQCTTESGYVLNRKNNKLSNDFTTYTWNFHSTISFRSMLFNWNWST